MSEEQRRALFALREALKLLVACEMYISPGVECVWVGGDTLALAIPSKEDFLAVSDIDSLLARYPE